MIHLFFFPSQLLLLQPYPLISKLLRKHRIVPREPHSPLSVSHPIQANHLPLPIQGVREFQCPIGLVQRVIGQRLEVMNVRAAKHIIRLHHSKDRAHNALHQHPLQTAQVRVPRVVNLNNTPGINPSTNKPSIHLNFFLRTNNRKRHHGLQIQS